MHGLVYVTGAAQGPIDRPTAAAEGVDERDGGADGAGGEEPEVSLSVLMLIGRLMTVAIRDKVSVYRLRGWMNGVVEQEERKRR